MTISTTSNKALWSGNGATTVFPFSFEINNSNEATLYYTDATGAVSTIPPSSYSIAGIGSPNGGTVTYPLSGSPIASGTSLTLVRTVALQQLTDLANQSNYFPDAVEGALDYSMMALQQIGASVNGSLQAPPADASPNMQLPAAAARANMVLGFDANGNPTMLLAGGSAGPVQASNVKFDGTTLDQQFLSRVNRVVDSIAAMQALNPATYNWCEVASFYGHAVNKLGGGRFYYDANVAQSNANGGTIFVATGYAGCWIRLDQSNLSVMDFGAYGDGVTVDTTAFNSAITALSGKAIYVPDPAVNYVIDSTITLPNNTTLYGQGKFSTKIFKKGNNDMFSFGDGAGIKNLWLDGQGATNTAGRGILIGAINTSDGHQNVENCRVVNFPDICLDFTDINAGSQFNATNVELNQYGATTGSNRFAVHIADAQQLSAVPRAFVGCEFNGTPSFNFGGCNDIFISGCFLGDLNYTVNSRGVQLENSRVANQTALPLYGHNHTIVGSDVNPQITLTAGVDNCHIGPNSMNNAPVIDNSGNGRNTIFQWGLTYTPTLSTSGTAPTLGNGTLTGRWSRAGATVTVDIYLSIGSTTNLGTGQLEFSLPVTNNLDIAQVGGAVYMVHAGTIYTGVVVIGGSSQQAALARDTSGAVTYNSPGTFAAGDVIYTSFTYTVGI